MLIFAASLLAAACSRASPPEARANEPEVARANVEDLRQFRSEQSFEKTSERLRQAIEDRGLTLMTVVDHSKNAAGVDLVLDPTRLFIFGKPEVGTRLMQESPTMAIDLPQRMLVYERGGAVKVAYYAPDAVARRHGIDDQDALLEKVSTVLESLATTATRR